MARIVLASGSPRRQELLGRMGIRDFVHGDYLSGTIRMIDALLIAASIAIGTGLVLSLYTFFTGVVVA